ncbi:hypothetical protein HNQ92_001471 [Rhabdobacter roseus]|uniref:DUF4136 domain-containing protein n=1 Tax=Rhabdobacter roseus TaxID=1655419 RepID=A0A840TK80_9BACT|nr:DUF4136 domain-containing protein [Rhabdobacter roseus]MBB5283345.1 hypothetical protein [Rhabdobacter roseus]
MTNKIMLMTLLMGTLLSACTNDPLRDLSIEDSQVFITNRNKSVDFRQYATFSIVDSVLILGNQGYGTSLSEIDVTILTRVIAKMQELGYQYVSASNNPDVGINVAQIRNSYLNVAPMNPYWGNYWGGGWGGWGGGWGPGMGYGPGYFTYYQTNEAYWYLEMIDFKNSNVENQELDVVWNAQIRGSGIGSTQQMGRIVDAVFEQSSYLKIN